MWIAAKLCLHFLLLVILVQERLAAKNGQCPATFFNDVDSTLCTPKGSPKDKCNDDKQCLRSLKCIGGECSCPQSRGRGRGRVRDYSKLMCDQKLVYDMIIPKLVIIGQPMTVNCSVAAMGGVDAAFGRDISSENVITRIDLIMKDPYHKLAVFQCKDGTGDQDRELIIKENELPFGIDLKHIQAGGCKNAEKSMTKNTESVFLSMTVTATLDLLREYTCGFVFKRLGNNVEVMQMFNQISWTAGKWGDACNIPEQCLDEFICLSNKCSCMNASLYFDDVLWDCTARRPYGSDCKNDYECISLACNSNKCTCPLPDEQYYDLKTKTCEPRRKLGVDCETDEQCLPSMICPLSKICSCMWPQTEYYDMDTMQCEPKGSPKDKCDDGNQCLMGLECSGSGGECSCPQSDSRGRPSGRGRDREKNKPLYEWMCGTITKARNMIIPDPVKIGKEMTVNCSVAAVGGIRAFHRLFTSEHVVTRIDLMMDDPYHKLVVFQCKDATDDRDHEIIIKENELPFGIESEHIQSGSCKNAQKSMRENIDSVFLSMTVTATLDLLRSYTCGFVFKSENKLQIMKFFDQEPWTGGEYKSACNYDNQCLTEFFCITNKCLCEFPGFYYDKDDKKCILRLPYESDCEHDDACVTLACNSNKCTCPLPDEQYYDLKTKTCEPRRKHGEKCETDGQCLPSLLCPLSNTCSCPETQYYDLDTKQCESEPKQPGEECKADEQCVYNCTDNKCSCQDAYFYDVNTTMCKELKCPDGYNRYGIYCYKFHLYVDKHEAGEYICESRKGMLPQPRTEEENDIINSILKENVPAIDKKFWWVKYSHQVWLGGKCRRRTIQGRKTCINWYWQNNKAPLIPANQFKWAFRQDNKWKGNWQACLTYWVDKGWNDYTCWFKLPIICEYRKNAKGELHPHAVLRKDKLWSDFIKKHGHPYKGNDGR